MHVLQNQKHVRARKGVPIKAQSFEGSNALVLLDVPVEPTGPLIPVLVPPVAGRPKEDMGGFADALVSTNRFVVVRPPFLNSGDEAPGTMERVAILPHELIHWGRWIRSNEFRNLLKDQFGVRDISPKTACCAASLGATLAVHAQAEEHLFDAMALFSYVPDYPEFVPRKLKISYEELVARTWRYRLKDTPEQARFYAALCRRIANEAQETDTQNWLLLAEHLERVESASLRDFALILEGIPFNAFHGFSLALRGIWDCQFDLAHNIERSLRIDIPLTFVIGLQDDYFDQCTMDRFLVEARQAGRLRRAVRLEDADHRIKPVTAFERGISAAIRFLSEDLGESIDFSGYSLSHVAMRRFHEVLGLSERHAPALGIPAAMLQKFMLNRSDLASAMAVLLSRPEEVTSLIQLLHEDYVRRDDGTTILDKLDPRRLAQIFDSALKPAHYASIATGIELVPTQAYTLFSKEFLQTVSLQHLDGIFKELAERGNAIVSIMAEIEPELVSILGERRALQQVKRAWEMVPAYQDVVKDECGEQEPKKLSEFPRTSKTTYIERFPIEARCIHGTLPPGGLIEESSGSSGKATDWIRCQEEDAYMVGGTRVFFDYLFKSSDSRPTVIISTFSQGTWASSSRLTILGRYAGMVKDIGTDAPRVIETIKRMGTGYHYVIAAYPPFFRELLLTGELTSEFSWKNYKVDVYHGGEGYTASWRKFVAGILAPDAKIVSGYGASDLEVSMAFETDAALAIRARLECDIEFRVALLGTSRMPVFLGQYNPLDTFLESKTDHLGRSTIVATVNNPCAWQPRVRYEIGDEGGLIGYWSAAAISSSAGVPVIWTQELKLPFLYLFGRIDGTISLDGANVYPNQVQEALFLSEEIGPLVKSFQLQRVEGDTGDISFRVLLETFAPIEGQNTVEVTEQAAGRLIEDYLRKNNTDFKEAMAHNDTLRPVVKLVKPGALGLEARIKHQYIGK